MQNFQYVWGARSFDCRDLTSAASNSSLWGEKCLQTGVAKIPFFGNAAKAFQFLFVQRAGTTDPAVEGVQAKFGNTHLIQERSADRRCLSSLQIQWKPSASFACAAENRPALQDDMDGVSAAVTSCDLRTPHIDQFAPACGRVFFVLTKSLRFATKAVWLRLSLEHAFFTFAECIKGPEVHHISHILPRHAQKIRLKFYWHTTKRVTNSGSKHTWMYLSAGTLCLLLGQRGLRSTAATSCSSLLGPLSVADRSHLYYLDTIAGLCLLQVSDTIFCQHCMLVDWGLL